VIVERVRLLSSLWTMSFRAAMQYRANFVMLVVMGLIYQGTGFAFIWVVLGRFPSLGGWTLGEVAFLYGLRLVMHALSMLGSGHGRVLGYQIQRGEFDRYLLRPLPPLMQIMSQGVQVNAFGDLLGGLLLFGAAITLVGIDWSPQTLAYLVLALIGGALLEIALVLLIGALALRVVDTGTLLFLHDTFFSSFGNYPLTIFGPALRWLLTFALPLAFMAYFPAVVLLRRTGELSVPPTLAYGAPLIGALWFALAVAVFQRALRQYQSVGH